MRKKYRAALKKNIGLLRASENIISALAERNDELDIITASVSAPVLYLYVRFILTQAIRRNIKHIYFLARDGYSMYRIAESLCNKHSLDIAVSYLYCSRHSLRMAAYHFKDQSAYDRLFSMSYSMSAENLLTRAEFDEVERQRVYDDIGYSCGDEGKKLSEAEFCRLCQRVRQSVVFNEILMEKSRRAYKSATEYFRQEGLGNKEKIAVADIGWTGSMQLALKRILEEDGVTAPLTGFYFGLLEPPPVYKDCEYVSWLFDGSNSACFKAAFSHNVMECICTAPHGMTMGYAYEGERLCPILAKCENNAEIVRRQSDIIAEFADNADCPLDYDRRDDDIARRLLKAFMFSPCREEAQAMAGYCFCDDVSENYHNSLAEKCSEERIRSGLIHTKLFGDKDRYAPLFWFCGSLALCDTHLKALYRMEYYLYNFIRYSVISGRSR